MLTKNVGYTFKNAEEKMLTTLKKLLTKNVHNIFKKCWWKKYWQQFKKLLIKNLKIKTCGVFVRLESVKWAIFEPRELYSSHRYPTSGIATLCVPDIHTSQHGQCQWALQCALATVLLIIIVSSECVIQ
jgi:hypothetical protein